MKRLLLFLLIVSAFVAPFFAQDESYVQTEFQESSESSALEIARDWKLLSIAAIMISVILVAIAYMIGIGFEMPEMKAWAGTELVQIFANVLIIAALIATIIFIDIIASAIAFDSQLNIAECSDVTQSCLKGVTNAYLDSYVEAARHGAEDTIVKNVNAAAWANRRMGLYALTIFLLQAGYGTTLAGHYVLDMDYYAIIFEYYSNILSSLEAQKFFVNSIAFNMGPIILAIGVVGRAFFFTRKAGGLLIAIAVGIMFFFPGMYIFDWVTLDTTLSGDKPMENQLGECPPECSRPAPLAYIEGVGVLEYSRDVYDSFTNEEADTAAQIINGSLQSAVGTNGSADEHVVQSCYYGITGQGCPAGCRDLPYPYSIPLCVGNNITIDEDLASTVIGTTEHFGTITVMDLIPQNDTYIIMIPVQEACAYLPEECKVIREATYVGEREDYQTCPDACKIVPPLQSNCDVDDCLSSSFDCRVAKAEDLDARPTKPHASSSIRAACNNAADCPANLTAENSCVYVLPTIGSCEELCEGCPAHCRIEGADVSNMADSCKNDDDELLEECDLCIETCKVTIEDIENLPGDCGSCDPEKRIVASWIPATYTSDECSIEECPLESDYRLTIPRNTCESCLFADESQTYNPPINFRCSDLCAPTDNVPVKNAEDYMKIGEDGLVGKSEIRNVAKMLIPAYLLPLFNIVATLVFIKGLSALLGGDIEIPGISKVF